MGVLDRIDKLAASIREDARIEDADAWWTDFRLIESDVERDNRTTDHEREIVGQIKSALSTFTMHIREGVPTPYTSGVRVSLGALKNQIRKRTTGPDGWPLK